MKKWSDIKTKNMSPERRARLERDVANELLVMDLRGVPETAGHTQVALAERDMTQSELSRRPATLGAPEAPKRRR
ncbi:MAG: hypothetical protein IPG50_02200 [Myxococcales bacterium]|nr:hypothetical protein [Myxococcales bacterium]